MIKYPIGIKNNSKNKVINYKNKGMSLENEINLSNEYYLKNKIAVIYKKPTPINVVKYDEKSKKITLAYYEKHSTTDYNGIYKSKYIDFEAKSTKNKTNFPLSNIIDYQIKHLVSIKECGGIGFLIISFESLNKYYLLTIETLLSFINENNRKSIPLNFFLKHAYEIKRTINPPLDYLKILDSFLK